MSTMTVTYSDSNGDDVEIELPAKRIVCPRCNGVGTHLHPAIGEHAYTAEEFYESFDDDEAEQYMTRGGMYDVPCEKCAGSNVVEVVDTDACTSDEDRLHLRAYNEYLQRQASYRAQERYIQAMGY